MSLSWALEGLREEELEAGRELPSGRHDEAVERGQSVPGRLGPGRSWRRGVQG